MYLSFNFSLFINSPTHTPQGVCLGAVMVCLRLHVWTSRWQPRLTTHVSWCMKTIWFICDEHNSTQTSSSPWIPHSYFTPPIAIVFFSPFPPKSPVLFLFFNHHCKFQNPFLLAPSKTEGGSLKKVEQIKFRLFLFFPEDMRATKQ